MLTNMTFLKSIILYTYIYPIYNVNKLTLTGLEVGERNTHKLVSLDCLVSNSTII